MDNRSLILSAPGKAMMLNCDKFVKALERGDGGETMRTAVLGTILGFDTYMFQNVNHVYTGVDTVAGTVTDAHAAGFAGRPSDRRHRSRGRVRGRVWQRSADLDHCLDRHAARSP